MQKVRVRFAPSPTGYLHLGSLRTALYDFVYARKTGGDFILRIEDTDQTRLVEDSVDNLITSLKVLGIDYDEGPHKDGGFGPYFQSQRLPLYMKHALELIEKGHAYYCFCSKETLDEMRKEQTGTHHNMKYDGRCSRLSKEEINRRLANGEPHVIRMKVPENRSFVFDDVIRGRVEIESELVDDQVIIKSDGFPTYHLAAVVDDHYMEITHVIRGEEWLSSTPKHIFLHESLGWTPPQWVHLPLLLGTDRSKMSKRQGDVAVESYLEKGYVKEAIINFVALLGWHPAGDKEIFSLEEMIQEFDFEHVNKAGAIFDVTKLDWMNGQYIRTLPLEYIAELSERYFIAKGFDISDRKKYLKVVDKSRNYVSILSLITDYAARFYNFPQIQEADKEFIQSESSQTVLKFFCSELAAKGEWNKEEVAALVTKGIETLGIKGKQYYQPLNLGFWGETSGPDIPTAIDILGATETIRRFQAIII
ncbi:MAG TPA: glutamate--tRNA ligase [Candidatus Cloacimonadota bacterium]|nr:glutamate--tRNA ligase [Candidatus Cloacimonadota bacterium]HPT71525.1 glutamate--tRNA ligase [Candidatus Cloacimonadota bacterium]